MTRMSKKSVHTIPLSALKIESGKRDLSKQVVVMAVALAMLVSVVGTFVVLNELASVERSIDMLRAHTALNAMLIKQQQERNAAILGGSNTGGKVSVEIRPPP